MTAFPSTPDNKEKNLKNLQMQLNLSITLVMKYPPNCKLLLWIYMFYMFSSTTLFGVALKDKLSWFQHCSDKAKKSSTILADRNKQAEVIIANNSGRKVNSFYFFNILA